MTRLAEMTKWTLNPGDRIERKVLQERYGGRTQGGIGPSKSSPNVLLFTDPASGEKHGYFDGWQPDGCFHYTGEGQFGDQRMLSGNAAIRRHAEEGRALRLFQGARGVVTYIDEFGLDPTEPWYETDAPESSAAGQDRKIRKVIVFKLRPKTTEPQRPTSKLAEVVGGSQVEGIPIESRLSEKSFVNPSGETYEAERREAALVERLAGFLRANGHSVYRHKIMPDDEWRPLFTDLYVEDLNLVIEGKGSATRENVRMAIGQLADYSRFFDGPKRAILLPSPPRPDLSALAASQAIAVIWPTNDGFSSSEGPETPVETLS
jgi:hypothetical protein